jgi:hypothetical protein
MPRTGGSPRAIAGSLANSFEAPGLRGIARSLTRARRCTIRVLPYAGAPLDPGPWIVICAAHDGVAIPMLRTRFIGSKRCVQHRPVAVRGRWTKV